MRGVAWEGLRWRQWGPQRCCDPPALLFPALGYGLLCLGMAYVSSMLGPVLQVGVGVQGAPPSWAHSRGAAEKGTGAEGCIPTGCYQHLWHGGRSTSGALLPRHVLSLCQPHGECHPAWLGACSPWNGAVLGDWGTLSLSGGQHPPCPPVQGAVVGLLAGLAMAFWVGIGSLMRSMGAAVGTPPPNSTVLPTMGNLTTVLATTLLAPTEAPKR